MSDEARRGRLILLALSTLLIIASVIDAVRDYIEGGFEDTGRVLGLVLWCVLLYKTYRGSTTARRLTVALLLLVGVTHPLLAFMDVEQEGIVIDWGITPDFWGLAEGVLALAAAVVLVASRPVRSFLEYQRGGGAA